MLPLSPQPPNEEIAALRQRAAAAELTPDLEEELSVALNLAHELKGIDDDATRLGFIFDCLLATPPKLDLAQDERLHLRSRTTAMPAGSRARSPG